MQELVRLTKDELDQFISSVKGRLKGVEALKKVVEHPDFGAQRNEREVQELFEQCPWLVDPTYTQFLLAADVALSTVFHRLAQELGIGRFARVTGDRKEPDLVFLIGNVSLRRVVIVELKASNIQLENEHLNQLEYYMTRAEEWLEEQNQGGFRVFGHLIGTRPSPHSRAEGAVLLRRRIKESGPEAAWSVRDYLEVLEDAKATHQELLQIHRGLEERAMDQADSI